MANPRPRVPPKEIRLRALGVEPLEPGEVSVVTRVRLPEEAVAVVEGLTPEARGRALLLGLEALGLWVAHPGGGEKTSPALTAMGAGEKGETDAQNHSNRQEPDGRRGGRHA